MLLKDLTRWINPLSSRRPAVTDHQPSYRDYARLEDRIVFSGSPIDFNDAGLDLSDDWVAESPDPFFFGPPESRLQEDAVDWPLDLIGAHGLNLGQAKEVAVVDAGIEDVSQLLDDLFSRMDRTVVDVIVVDAERDGIKQVTSALSMYDDLEAIHVISHGAEGQVRLGNTVLDSQTLRDYSDDVAAWGESLRRDGDLLFYGCDVASDAKGLQLLEELRHLTLADIAASDDATGTTSFSGDWELEFSSGIIQTQVFSGVTSSWQGTLGNITVTTTADVIDGANDEESITTKLDQFSFTVDDGQGAVSAGQLPIGIANTEQVLVTNLPLNVDEGSVAKITSQQLWTTDADHSSSQLVYTVVSGPSNGDLRLTTQPGMKSVASFTQEDIDNNSLVYAHNGSETLRDQFVFSVDDGAGAETVDVFQINVRPVNDAPELTVPGVQDMAEQTKLRFSPANGNSVTVADNDAGTGVVELRIVAPDGGLFLAPSAGVSLVQGNGTGDSLLVLRGTISDLNAALTQLAFEPDPGYIGLTAINFSIDDNGNAGNPGPQTDNASIPVRVYQSPDANDDYYQVLGGQTLIVTHSDSALLNDFQPTGSLTTSILVGPFNGTLSWNQDGTFIYVARPGFIGVDGFVYELANGPAADNAVVRIEVLPATPSPPPVTPGPPTNPGPDIGGIPIPSSQVPSDSPFRSSDPEPEVSTQSDGERDAVLSTNRSTTASSSDVHDGVERDLTPRRDIFRYNVETSSVSVGTVVGPNETNTVLAGASFDSEDLIVGLDALTEALQLSEEVWLVPSGLALTGGLSLGWMLILKGAYIIASLVSTASPWTVVDPLPVLDTFESDRKHGINADKLEQMVD